MTVSDKTVIAVTFAIRLRSLIAEQEREVPILRPGERVCVGTAMRPGTRADLAQETGLDYQRIGHWVNAKTMPRAQTLIQLADHFGVSTDYLLGLTDNRERNV